MNGQEMGWLIEAGMVIAAVYIGWLVLTNRGHGGKR